MKMAPDAIIANLNDMLAKHLALPDPEREVDEHRPFFVIGVPRSGTTLVLQAILTKYDVYYISNLIAKFWSAPSVGLAIQKRLLPQLDYRSGYTSDYGYIDDALLEPHDISYFWARWFHHREHHYHSPDERIDEGFSKEIARLIALAGRHYFFKNLTLSLNVPILKRELPKARFVFVHRHPLYVAQSLFKGRIERLGDIREYISLRPKEIDSILALEPTEQVVAQVYYSYQQIVHDLRDQDPADYVMISYEEFCRAPEAVLGRELSRFELPVKRTVGELFSPANERKIEGDNFEGIREAYAKYDFHSLLSEIGVTL